MFASWGRAVDRLRWWLVALSLLPLTLWLGVPSGERLDESVVPPDMEAVRAVRLLDAELAPRPPSFGLIFSHAGWRATDPAFLNAVTRALEPLRPNLREQIEICQPSSRDNISVSDLDPTVTDRHLLSTDTFEHHADFVTPHEHGRFLHAATPRDHPTTDRETA